MKVGENGSRTKVADREQGEDVCVKSVDRHSDPLSCPLDHDPIWIW